MKFSDIPQSTCQICGRPIKANTGVIAHHGYKRPGTGWQTASCMGARSAPYEQSRDRLPFAIAAVSQWIESANVQLAALKVSPPDTLSVQKKSGYAGRNVSWETVTRPDDFRVEHALDWNTSGVYNREFRRLVRELEADLKQAHMDRDYFQTRYDRWTPPNEGQPVPLTEGES